MILFVGDVGIDCYQSSAGETFYWGGCSLNAWRAAKRVNGEHRLLSIKGESMLPWPDDLKRESSQWPSSNKVLPCQKLMVDETGERHFLNYKLGALADLKFDESWLPFFKDVKIVALPLYRETLELCLSLLSCAQLKDIKFALDLSTMSDFKGDVSFLAPYLEKLVYVQSSKHQANLDLRAYDLHHVVTNGEKPLKYFYKNAQRSFEFAPVEVVDSTGSGDCFFGTLLATFLKTGHMMSALGKANQATHRVLRKCGPN